MNAGQYGKVAIGTIIQTGEYWTVMVETRAIGKKKVYTLDKLHETPGAALDELDKWARTRRLTLAIDGVPLHIVRLPQSLMHEKTDNGGSND